MTTTTMQANSANRWKMAIAGGLIALLSACGAAFGQSTDTAAPSLVEVYWKSARTVFVPDITSAIVLDEEITRAKVGPDSVQFLGLERGETVVVAYAKDKAISIRVRVIEKPQISIPPSLLRMRAEMAQGSIDSTTQISDGGGTTSIAFLHGFSWSQPEGANGHLDINGEVENNSLADGRAFNVRRAAVVYQTPSIEVRALDFNVNLVEGGWQGYVSPLSFSDSVELRGADVSLNRGKNQYSLFGGTTIPFFYLTLGSTRDVAGFSFQRKETEALSLFATTSFINAPLDTLALGSARRNNVMQTAGATYIVNPRWAMRGTGGASNHGNLARGEITYTGSRMSAFAAGTRSSPLFPLNQIESIFSGTSSVKAGWNFRSSNRLTESFYTEQSITSSVGGLIHAGSSYYFSPSLSAKLTKAEDVSFAFTRSHNEGGLATEPTTGNRFDVNWNSNFQRQISNSAQMTVGSLQDPLQLNSQDEFSVRDSVSFPLKGNVMFLSLEHSRTNPSLEQKLNAELGLLSPALQQLFLADPVSFVDSSNLPPEIRALLESQQPTSTSISAGSQLHLARGLTFNPNFSLAQSENGNTESWTPFFGYNLVYRLSRDLQLRSSLSSVWALSDTQGGVRRTNVFSFGLRKTFSATPSSLTPWHHKREIQGRVFRDSNINGTFNTGEPGLPGIEVQLDGSRTVVTDKDGRFEFDEVGAGEHEVSLSLTQFRDPVRMTTPARVAVDSIREKTVVVNFGIVDFARLIGNVYNDLRFEGKRPADATGLPGIRLTLDDGSEKRELVTGGTGDYQIDDVAPGNYTLTLETATLPANYSVPQDTFHLHINPVSTVVQDVPARALRSISGTVLLQIAPEVATKASAGQNGKSKFVPMAHVQLAAGSRVAETDENGKFIMRDLPAGDVTVSVVPINTLPKGMKAPSGTAHMPSDPIQVQGATIVIGNPDLVPYLVDPAAHTLVSKLSN